MNTMKTLDSKLFSKLIFLALLSQPPIHISLPSNMTSSHNPPLKLISKFLLNS